MSDERPPAIELIQRARDGDHDALNELFAQYRNYLRSLAQRQIGAPVATRMDASDIVQKTYLEAHRTFGAFLGIDEPQLLAWLKSILDHNVADAIRDHVYTAKRAVKRQRSIDDSRVAPGYANSLAADQSSPSQRVMRGEAALTLARALDRLPDDQREAVRLRHLEGYSLAQLAEHFGRSEDAAAGLVKRGLQTLRKIMNEEKEE